MTLKIPSLKVCAFFSAWSHDYKPKVDKCEGLVLNLLGEKRKRRKESIIIELALYRLYI